MKRKIKSMAAIAAGAVMILTTTALMTANFTLEELTENVEESYNISPDTFWESSCVVKGKNTSWCIYANYGRDKQTNITSGGEYCNGGTKSMIDGAEAYCLKLDEIRARRLEAAQENNSGS